MRKKIFVLAIALFANIQAQEFCATDAVQVELERKNPEVKKAREEAEARLSNTDILAYLEKRGAVARNNGNYTGTIYEIPVVVHVIEASTGDAQFSITDAEIETWIENANKMFAATYTGTSSNYDFFPAGNGIDESAVIPFKLVLAKRDQQCSSFSGIKRYNGNTLPGYTQYGIKRYENNGPSEADVKELAPQWDESSYYNMYIVAGFDGNFTNYGLMGYAGYPTNPDTHFRTVMKAPVVTKPNSKTLAHEFGHSLGLKHTFDGANSNGGECTPNNGDCTQDNDKICDTEYSQSAYGMNPIPTNDEINPCTGQNYQGVQYNVMNYTKRAKKFTSGQRTRALAMFLEYRGNLTTSLAGTPLDNNNETLTQANCTVTGITNSSGYGIGPKKVVLGSINNTSSGNSIYAGSKHYVDYTTKSCLNTAFSTDIPKDEASVLKVSIGANNQHIKAWIDYNDNGTFEDNEVIANQASSTANQEHSFSFTPPASAVVNTNLRMRVASDWVEPNACGVYQYGQAEDYIVKVIDGLSVEDVTNTAENYTVVYQPKDNTIRLLDTKENFGAYQIFDFSGKLIQKGKVSQQTIHFNNTYPKGGYIIKFTHQNKEVSVKFLK